MRNAPARKCAPSFTWCGSGPNGSRRTPTTGWRLSTRSHARGARVPGASCSMPFRNMIHLVKKWAERKSKNAYDWLAALYAITCKGSKSTGSIVFYAFPQDLVNMIAERTGGRPVTVAIPDLVDGDVYIDEDGNVYLVDQVGDGQGQIIERA